MKKTIIVSIFVLVLLSNLVFAATYYVSFNTGNDGNVGNITHPFKTFDKVTRNLTLAAGDNVYFNRGETWRGYFNYTNSSGTLANKITFGAYGSGNNPKWYGSQQANDTTILNLTNISATAWQSAPLPVNVSMIFCNTTGNEIWGRNFTNVAALSQNCDFFMNTTTSRINIYWNGNITNNTLTGGIEIPVYTIAGLLATVINQQKNYLTFENIEVAYCQNTCIYNQLGTGITFENMTIRKSWSKSIWLNGAGSTTNNTIKTSLFNDTGIRGFFIGAGETIWVASQTNTKIISNTLINPHGVAINGFNAVRLNVSFNTVKDQTSNPSTVGFTGSYYFDAVNHSHITNNYAQNCSMGISINAEQAGQTSDNNTIMFNTINSCEMALVINSNQNSVLSVKNTNITQNTFYKIKDQSGGLSYDMMLKYFTNLSFYNNNFVDNSSGNDYVTQYQNYSGNVFIDYNNYYFSSGNYTWAVNNTDYNRTQWNALNNDVHSVYANPYFYNKTNNDFRPRGDTQVCTNSSTGSYVGSFACYGWNQINDTQHHVLGENQTIVLESATNCANNIYKVRDGDWSTYFFTNAGCAPSTANIVYNYNKPNLTLNQRLLAGNLTVRHQYATELISILNTDTCFLYNSNYVQVGYNLAGYCNNGTENITLYYQPDIFQLYEQKMNWTIGQSNINLTEQTTPIYENNTLTFNAVQTNYPTFTTEVYIYNSTKHLLYTYSGIPNITVILNFTHGIYFINATSYNQTHYTHSNNVNYTWYSANTTIITPITNQNVTRYLNVSYASSFTSNLVNVSYYNLSVLNSTGHLKFYVAENNGVNTSFNNFFTYAQNLSTGIYAVKISMFDTAGYWTHSQTNINITRNTLLNISVRTALENNTIANFSFNDFIYSLNFNETQNSTTGNLLLDSIRGNHTFIIDANQYFASENVTTINISNINIPIYNYFFYLYESNTLNISFYDQANPFTLLTGINISMDMFSSIYSNNFTTNNGTLYLTLLIPTTYTLRYSAPGYSQRFYEVTVDNRSYQNVNLYLINGSVTQNITITVIDEIGNPVEGAVVKALKYNLPTNTYIQQEIGVTNAEGKVVMHLTMNDEYYKFIVEVDGDVVKITDPAYITSTTYTIQITTGSAIGTEFTEYYTISHSLSFNTATNNFRFDFTDSNNIASQFCLYIYQYNNFSSTTYNSSCTTDASGTILLGVAPINGTTYLAKSYYVQDGNNKQLGQLYHTFTGSTVLTTTYGLLLQFLVTGFFAFTGIVSMSLAAIITPFSLIIGKLIFLNSFSWNALIGLQVIGIIIAFMLTRTR